MLAAGASRRVRYALLAGAVFGGLDEYRRTRPGLDPVSYLAIRRLDDLGYGYGVWLGAVRQRTIAPLVPRLTGLGRLTVRRPAP